MQKVVAFLKKLVPVLLNARVWLPILGVVVTAALADGLIAPTGWMHTFAVTFLDVLGRLGIYSVAGVAGVGIVAAGAWQRPRKSLADMTDAEREEVFQSNPQVRERWEAQQKLLQTPPRTGTGL
jgi:hypothetical protein